MDPLLNFTKRAGMEGLGGGWIPFPGDAEKPARPMRPGDDGSTTGIERDDGGLEGFGRSITLVGGLVWNGDDTWLSSPANCEGRRTADC